MRINPGEGLHPLRIFTDRFGRGDQHSGLSAAASQVGPGMAMRIAADGAIGCTRVAVARAAIADTSRT